VQSDVARALVLAVPSSLRFLRIMRHKRPAENSGWGKAGQPITGGDEDSAIVVEIIQKAREAK
jgi:hypothetical protein